MGAWRNGRRRGLKNLGRKACGFESHRPYQLRVCRMDSNREVASVKRTRSVRSERASRPEGGEASADAAGGRESLRPYQSRSLSSA